MIHAAGQADVSVNPSGSTRREGPVQPTYWRRPSRKGGVWHLIRYGRRSWCGRWLEGEERTLNVSLERWPDFSCFQCMDLYHHIYYGVADNSR